MLASWEEASCAPHNIICCIIQHIKPSLCARLVPDLFIWASHSLTKLCDPHQRDGGAGLTKLLWMMISSDFVSVELKWYQLAKSVVALFHNEMTMSLNNCELSSRGDQTCLTCFGCRNSSSSNSMNLECLGLNMEHCNLHLAKKNKCNGWNGHGEYSNVLQSLHEKEVWVKPTQDYHPGWVKLCHVDNVN